MEFRLHTVTYSEVDANGFIGVQFDAFGEENSGMPTVETHHAYAYRSRPRDPDKNGAFGCNVLVAWEGPEAHAWIAADPRYINVLPKEKAGGSTHYCATKFGATAVSFEQFDGDSGGYTLYVPEFGGSGTVTGAYCIIVDPVTRAIQIVHPDGFAVVLSQDGIQMRGDASTWLKLGKGVFEVVAASIKLRGVVALGASAETGVPLLPGLASQPTPSVYFSPT